MSLVGPGRRAHTWRGMADDLDSTEPAGAPAPGGGSDIPFEHAIESAVTGLRPYPPLLLGLAGALVLGAVALLRPADLRTAAIAIVVVLIAALVVWALVERRRLRGQQTLNMTAFNRADNVDVDAVPQTRATFGWFNRVGDVTIGRPRKR